MWPVRLQVRCPNTTRAGNPWTFRGKCELEGDPAVLLHQDLQKLYSERLEAIQAVDAYADRVAQAERKVAEVAAKTGISPQIIARENKVPPKRRTLMDVDTIGAKWAIDAQAGKFVA